MINNIIGQKFGKLEVLEIAFKEQRYKKYKYNIGKNGNTIFWRCKCDCGNITVVTTGKLRTGHTKSCGCLTHLCGNKNKHWKGVGELPGKYFLDIKQGAKRRNLDFDLTKEFLWELFLKQERKCCLSNLPLCFKSRDTMRDGTASLDRIDSNKGYIKDNVQWVHKDINNMKQDINQNAFINYCKLIVETKNHK